MSVGYAQFCPVAKASEVFAARWTPLILRELMSGMHAFNDIHRGVPLISRAVLVARLRELEKKGIVERRPRAEGNGHEYWLTPPGEDFGAVMNALGQWGLRHTSDRIEPSDLDPALLLWGLRKQVLSERAARTPHRPALRILGCAGKPHQIPDHVAGSRTQRRRRMRQGPRICRRSHPSRRHPRLGRRFSRPTEMACRSRECREDRRRSKNSEDAGDVAAA